MKKALSTCGLALVLFACGGDAKLPPLHDPEKPGGKSTGNKSNTTSSSVDNATADAPNGGQPDVARSTRSSLQWKRYATFEADLAQALELGKDELCNEFGSEPCIRGVHLSPLGGHDPFKTGLLESSAEPLVTTATVVERIVLSACIARREKDRALGGDAVVFKGLSLEGDAPAPSDDGARSMIAGLYKRFLARDAEAFELDTLAALARDQQGVAISAADFAASVCLAVGSHTEFLFF